jgi:hypothetical protein
MKTLPHLSVNVRFAYLRVFTRGCGLGAVGASFQAYRPLPPGDAQECAALAQKLKAETAAGTAAAPPGPSKEPSHAASRRRLRVGSGVSADATFGAPGSAAAAAAMRRLNGSRLAGHSPAAAPEAAGLGAAAPRGLRAGPGALEGHWRAASTANASAHAHAHAAAAVAHTAAAWSRPRQEVRRGGAGLRAEWGGGDVRFWDVGFVLNFRCVRPH